MCDSKELGQDYIHSEREQEIQLLLLFYHLPVIISCRSTKENAEKQIFPDCVLGLRLCTREKKRGAQILRG